VCGRRGLQLKIRYYEITRSSYIAVCVVGVTWCSRRLTDTSVLSVFWSEFYDVIGIGRICLLVAAVGSWEQSRRRYRSIFLPVWLDRNDVILRRYWSVWRRNFWLPWRPSGWATDVAVREKGHVGEGLIA
jgi:hypothetical protein